MIRVSGLRKSYGTLLAVDNISFEAGPGEIYGLLGPNGAGKTTTLSMIAGLLKPDAGSVEIAGISMDADPRAAKRLLGVVPQEVTLYEDLSARENLLFWGRVYGMGGRELDRRIAALLERGGLAEKAKKAVKTYSGGMKRRLNLLTGLVHEPKVLLLDEATVGIDPQGRIAILDLVRETAAAGTTVVYTTHYLEEAEDLCRRVGIIDHGRMLVEGTARELVDRLGEGELVVLSGGFAAAEIRAALGGADEVEVVSAEEGRAALSVALPGPEVLRLLNEKLGHLDTVEEISVRRPSLQSLFIKLTGREIRE
ncbi:MAG: ABC transporter ATP-binding protein [Candidatus Eisenbacteria bacterium]|nr:ABC transporter ATP-binding protein [Candidatus Eisenbacteria bacterium]